MSQEFYSNDFVIKGSLEVENALLSGTVELYDLFGDAATVQIVTTSQQALTAQQESLQTIVQTNSASWGASNEYGTAYANASASYATTNYVSSNYFSVSGGVINGDVSINGNFFVANSSTYLSAVNLVLSDPLIYLAEGNPSDSVDIGFMGSFSESPIGYQHTGLVRTHSDNKWTLFSGLTTEPLTSTVINTLDETFTIDTLKANIEGNLVATNTNVLGSLSASGTINASNLNVGNWNSVYSTVETTSANWNRSYDIGTAYSLASSSFLTSETDSQTLSFDENSKDLSISNGNTVSLSSLTDAFTTDSQVRALTSDWNSTFNTVQANSAINWDNALSDNFTQTNFLPLSGGTISGKLIASADNASSKLNIGNAIGNPGPSTIVDGDLWITNQNKFAWRANGNTINAAGLSQTNTFNQPQTIGSTSNASAVLIVNNTGTREAATFSAQGTSPAIRVTQTGTGNAFVVEDSTNPDATPFVIDSFGSVGIGLSSLSGIEAKLTVIGNISSTAVLYTSGGNSDEWSSAFSTIQTNSADWNNVYSTVRSNSATNWNYQGTDLKSLSSNWESTYTTVTNTSSSFVQTDISNATPGLSAIIKIVAVSAIPLLQEVGTMYVLI